MYCLKQFSSRFIIPPVCEIRNHQVIRTISRIVLETIVLKGTDGTSRVSMGG